MKFVSGINLVPLKLKAIALFSHNDGTVQPESGCTLSSLCLALLVPAPWRLSGIKHQPINTEMGIQCDEQQLAGDRHPVYLLTASNHIQQMDFRLTLIMVPY